MPNLRLELKQHLSAFRRIAIGTWRTVGDPTVYGTLALPFDRAEQYLAELRRRTGRRVTITHMMAKAVAHTLEAMPDANAVLRFNRLWLRKDIGVFFQVAMEDPETGEVDLSGATLFDAHKKTLVELTDEFEAKVRSVREHKDPELEGSRNLFHKIPAPLLHTALDAISFLSYELNLDLRRFGIPNDAFGSAMVTNIGSLGLEEAYVPLVPYSHVPLLLAVGNVRTEPTVRDGELTTGRVLRVFATFDHRVLDGMHAARMSKTLKALFEDPEKGFGPLPPEPPA